ncbi:MAG: FAD-binding protein, partial [Pseudonocardiaceae bacterium]
MSERVSRRRLMQGAAATAAAGVIVGFDPTSRSWATEINRRTVPVPPLDGSLTMDQAARQEAADDYGHIVHRLPVAVLRPGSINDVVVMVRYAVANRLKIAMRGQGHVCFGQAQVEAGIVIDSRTMNAIHAIESDRAVVGPGVTWGELLRATVAQDLTPPVLTDFMGLSVGGTLSGG